MRSAVSFVCSDPSTQSSLQFVVRSTDGRLTFEFPPLDCEVPDDALATYWLHNPKFPHSDGHLWERRSLLEELVQGVITCFRFTRHGFLIGVPDHPGLILIAATVAESGDDFLYWFRDE